MLLELFYYDSCPYCQDVMEVLEDLNIKIEMLNILSNRDHLNRLVQDTGRRTVPCMYIDNKPMFESRDINRWLQANKDQLPQNG